MLVQAAYDGAVASVSAAPVPPPLAGELKALEDRLLRDGLHGALRLLNARTPHRFTGVFRFDGETLRSVALVDKWDPHVLKGEDLPIAQAYCAHLRDTGEPLEVVDGDCDPRTPWMTGRGIPSYCGALIRDGGGQPWGALCHFDYERCEAKNSDMPLLIAAAALLHPTASRHRQP